MISENLLISVQHKMMDLNRTDITLAGLINGLNDPQSNLLSCELANLSSLLLKQVNIILVKNLLMSNRSIISVEENASLTNDSNSTTSATADDAMRSDYSYTGALVYIVFILFWYSTAVVILIKMQTKNNDLYYFENCYDSEEKDVHNVLKSIRERNVKRQALGKQFTRLFWISYE
jgi:hypothetical protein